VPQTGVENITALASTHEDAEGLVLKVTFLKGELLVVHRARGVAEEKFYHLSNAVATVRGGWWCPKGSAGSSLMSSPFCRHVAPSCVLPLLAHHG
jgi:hypothetical protein